METADFIATVIENTPPKESHAMRQDLAKQLEGLLDGRVSVDVSNAVTNGGKTQLTFQVTIWK